MSFFYFVTLFSFLEGWGGMGGGGVVMGFLANARFCVGAWMR